MDGQGIGAIMGGAAALIGVAFTIFRTPQIIDAWKSHAILKAERDDARHDAERERRRAEAAERWAQNSDGAAERAGQENDELIRRIERVEELIEYTRGLLLWALYAERLMREHGIMADPYPPPPAWLPTHQVAP